MLLSIYLNDHLAGATAGRELARRAAGANRGTPLGAFLEKLAQEIDEDRDALLALMRALEVDVDRLKVIGGWAAEKAGRLKRNGRWLHYSPLSRLVELEALVLALHGKLALWSALEELEGELPGLEAVDLQQLRLRADRQLRGLERQRLRAAPEALVAR
jgi:hypothetical protein